MINLISHQGKIAYGVKTFIFTEEAEKDILPNDCAVGSLAFLLTQDKNTQKSYCFNGESWIETDFPMYTFNIITTIEESNITKV